MRVVRLPDGSMAPATDRDIAGLTGRRLLPDRASPPATDIADGRLLKARPTTYNGIAMRSRLEARYAAWLDARKYRWEYEPMCFANEHGQYLPDFVIHDVTFLTPKLVDVYVEVKPIAMSNDRLDDLIRRQEAIWATHPHAVIVIEVAATNQLVIRARFTNGDHFFEGHWSYTTSGGPALYVPCRRTWTVHPDDPPKVERQRLGDRAQKAHAQP